MKYQVQYVRIENHLYLLEVEAENEKEAEKKANEEFSGSENYEVVHAEEFIHDVIKLNERG